MTDFLKFIEKTKTDALLPDFSFNHLTHLTDFYKLRKIIEAGEVVPSPCPVFHENLVYFFHSRPAYRVNNNGSAAGSAAWYPCCLVFKENNVAPKRVYPFDSGGFAKKMYARYLHHDIGLDQMELRPDYNNLKEFMTVFYNSREKYFYGEPKKMEKESFSLCFEAEGYYNMISDNGLDTVDDRCSAVEVQSGAAIKLSELALLVVPSSNRSETEALLRGKGISCPLETYRLVNRSRPGEYLSEIRTIVFNFFNTPS